jgi:ElaB/YqjD/DUF883 family membrane-anchored ribosome-binding protein
MAATSTEKTETSEQPSSEDVRQVIDEAEHVLAEGAKEGHQKERDFDAHPVGEPSKARKRSRAGERAVTAAGLAGGEAARRGVKEAVGLKLTDRPA